MVAAARNTSPNYSADAPRRTGRHCDYLREELWQSGLFKHGVRGMASLDLAIDRKVTIRHWAVPDVVIAPIVAMETAACGGIMRRNSGAKSAATPSCAVPPRPG